MPSPLKILVAGIIMRAAFFSNKIKNFQINAIFAKSFRLYGQRVMSPKIIMEDTQMFSWGLNLASSILEICHEGKAEAIVNVVNDYIPF